MTELKCPICGERLVYWGATGALLKCPKCLFGWGTEELWQALIDTKKKLDKAIDLLEMLYGDYNLDWAVVDSDKVYDFLKQINQKEER